QTVEGHLAGCPRCALALERLRAFPLRLGHLTAVAPPPDFTTRLMRRIEPLPPPRELAGLASAQGYGPLRGPMGAILALASAAAGARPGPLADCGLWIADCGVGRRRRQRATRPARAIPQSAIRNPQSP